MCLTEGGPERQPSPWKSVVFFAIAQISTFVLSFAVALALTSVNLGESQPVHH